MYAPSYEETLKQFMKLYETKGMSVPKLAARLSDQRLTNPLRLVSEHYLDAAILHADPIYMVIHINGY